MHYIFSAGYPAVIKSDGKYLGDITRKTAVVEGDNPFIEICPINGSGRALNFIVNAELLSSPPENLRITDLNGGYHFFATPDYSFGEFRVLAQQKYSDCVATVFFDNGLKISVETKTGFCADALNVKVSTATISREKENPDLLSVFLDGELLCVYYLRGENPVKAFCDFVDGYDTSGGLTTRITYKDIAKHTVETKWKLDGNKFIQSQKTVSSKKDLTSLCGKTLLYAFAEEYAVGGNYTFFLADNVKENADKLTDYIGKIEGVMPPPFFIEYTAVGLIRKTGKNTYRTDYLYAETENGKITNLKIK